MINISPTKADTRNLVFEQRSYCCSSSRHVAQTLSEDGTYWCVLPAAPLPCHPTDWDWDLGPLPAQMCLLILSSQSHNRHIGRADRILNIHVTSGRGQRGVWPHAGAGSRGGGRQEGRPVSRIRCPTILVVTPDGLAMPMTSPPHLLLYRIPVIYSLLRTVSQHVPI